MLKGLNKFYGFDSNPQVLINGSSMVLAGFNKSELEKNINKKISLYAKEGVGVEDRFAMLEHFFSEHTNTVKTVIYEVNPLLFSNKLTAANVYSIFYPFMDNNAIDQYIFKRADKLDYLTHKYCRASRFDAITINFVLKGYMNNYDNFKTVSLNPETTYFTKDQQFKIKIEFNQNKISVFEKSINLLKKNNVKIIIVMMPIYYQKQATFDSLTYNQLVSYFKSFSASNNNINYFDLNTDELSNNALFFSDLVHLNREGQKKVTEMVTKHLKESGSF